MRQGLLLLVWFTCAASAFYAYTNMGTAQYVQCPEAVTAATLQ